jgi:hypothetical protein
MVNLKAKNGLTPLKCSNIDNKLKKTVKIYGPI